MRLVNHGCCTDGSYGKGHGNHRTDTRKAGGSHDQFERRRRRRRSSSWTKGENVRSAGSTYASYYAKSTKDNGDNYLFCWFWTDGPGGHEPILTSVHLLPRLVRNVDEVRRHHEHEEAEVRGGGPAKPAPLHQEASHRRARKVAQVEGECPHPFDKQYSTKCESDKMYCINSLPVSMR